MGTVSDLYFWQQICKTIEEGETRVEKGFTSVASYANCVLVCTLCTAAAFWQ